MQPTVAERARAARLQAKAARPLLSISVRLLAAAPQAGQAERRVASVAAGWHQFTTAELHFQRRRPLSLPRLVRAVRDRARVRIPAPTLLNTSELAAVLAVTPDVARANGLVISPSRRLAAPRVVPERGIVLGVSPTGRGERTVAVPLVDLARHAHVVGPTGVGKSTLLAQIAIQAIEQGASVVVLDGKDELADLILPRISPNRAGHVGLLDAADRDHVWSLNPLAQRTGDRPEVIADDVLTPIRELFAASWGQRTEHYLRLLLLTMLGQPGEATLLDAVIALHDDETLHRITAHTNDPVLAAAWRGFFSQSDAARAEILMPLRNKLASLAVGGLRDMLGGGSTIDIDQALNTGGVLLPRFSKSRLGEDTARLGASLFMTMVWQAIRRRSSIPPEQRRPVLIIADEFADYTRLSVDFEAVLSQARSLGVGLVLAHQELHQLPPSMRHAVMANARTRCIYPVGAEDARVLARELEPHLSAEHLRGLPAYEIAATISAAGHTTQPFTARTLPLGPGDPAAARRVIAESRRRHTIPRKRADAILHQRLNRLLHPSEQRRPRGRYGRRPLTDRMTDRPDEHIAGTAQPSRNTADSDRDTSGAQR
ncbi:MAG: type IV secretory system conjugative DNA transfer family protein [Mycobacteriales bacterium]